MTGVQTCALPISFPGPGGQWQISTAGGTWARWSPNGKELYYIAPDGNLMAAPISVNGPTLEPGEAHALFRPRMVSGNVSTKQQYDVGPDGRFLINVTEDAPATPITLLLNWKPQGK